MAVCTYDNPATMHRECWQDGRLICSYSFNVFFLKDEHRMPRIFFGANIGPWKKGQLYGDRSAMMAS